MADRRWLDTFHPLPGGAHVKSMYAAGDLWQLYTTLESGMALVVAATLYDDWILHDALESGLFLLLPNLPAEKYPVPLYAFTTRPGQLLSSVSAGPYPERDADAFAFARALHYAQERFPGVSFADGIYIAQFSVILPMSHQTVPQDPEANGRILGKWICAGAEVSLTEVARVTRLAPWLQRETLERILRLLNLSTDSGNAALLDAPPKAAEPDAVPVPAYGTRSRKAAPFSLPGRRELETFFREQILDIIDREDAYRRMGVPFPGAVLLQGPPGSGKTFAVEQLVRYLDWPVYRVTSGSIGSKYIHETSRKISELFDTAIANAPSVILIDELEAFLSSREENGSGRDAHFEEVAEFLRRIPEASSNRVLLFGMTNLAASIDPAILRRGRFDHILEVDLPDEAEIRALLESLLNPLPVQDDVDLDALAASLAKKPISDIAFVVREAGRLTVRANLPAIGMEQLRTACEQLTPHEQKRTIGF